MKMDFKNPEEWKRLERCAYEGTVDCTHFPPAAYRYFTELTKLYHAYRFEGLSAEQAAVQKQKLLSQYHEAVLVFEQAKQTYCDWQENIQRAGTMRTSITKSDDVREKLRFAVQCIGAMTGDRVFEKTELKKLEKENETD